MRWNTPPGETEAGSAGRQPTGALFAPDNHWPGLRCAKGVSGPDWDNPVRAFCLEKPLDIGAMPKKIPFGVNS